MALANQWFAFYGGDYERDTGDLTLVEHGAYLKLMLHCYNTGEALPEEPAKLQRICRAHSDDELQAISNVISRFFIKRSDGLHNVRCDSELKKARHISKVRRAARYGKRKTIVNQKSSISAIQPQPQLHTQEPKVKSVFAPPALGEVIAYCQERKNSVDPQHWFNHYTANGWMVGRNKMRDWRAAVRTWEKNSNETNRSNRPQDVGLFVESGPMKTAENDPELAKARARVLAREAMRAANKSCTQDRGRMDGSVLVGVEESSAACLRIGPGEDSGRISAEGDRQHDEARP